jgi:hypothetical protein
MDQQARLKELSRRLDLLQRADRPTDEERLKMQAIRNEMNAIRKTIFRPGDRPGDVEREKIPVEETLYYSLDKIREQFGAKK